MAYFNSSDEEQQCGECSLPEKPTRRIGSFLLGFGAVLLLCGSYAALTKQGISYNDTPAADSDSVPAISSSASLPMLDPPASISSRTGMEDFDADASYGVSASPLPFVQKVNPGQLPYGHPDPNANYPKYEGFTLWVAEEFNEPIDLDTDPIWTYSDGGLTEGQVRFVKDAIKFKDGKMIVEVSNQGLPQGDHCSHAEVGYVGHKPLTSGELRTRYNMYRYGRYESRFKAPSVRHNDPNANGNYISTMFVYRDAKFKHWREIDFEVTADAPNTVTSNVLKADGTSSWTPGIQASVHGHPRGIHVRRDFNEYAFEWLPNKITWWINGHVQRVHTGGHVGVPDMPAKIMMNLWIFTGGGFGGPSIKNNQYPMHSEYDWFRFYKWDGDKQYPCPAMDASCLKSDDLYLASNNPCDGIEQQGTVNGRRPCNAVCNRKASYDFELITDGIRDIGDTTPEEAPAPALDETPAISSSASLPMLDPPHRNEDFDDTYAITAPHPVVQKVKVGSLPYGHPNPNTWDYPKHDGFTLWVVEEFNEPIDLDTDPIWTYSDGGLTEGQVRFVKDAIEFKDGKMIIEVSNKGLPQGPQCSHAEVGFVGHKPLTSGEFRTRYNMYRYGRYESRLKAPSVRFNDPNANGNFISTMFVYRDAKFRHWREIDFEITADAPNTVTSNVLKADATSSWNPGIQASVHGHPKGIHVRRDFHEYAFEWLPNKITWWIDGNLQRVHSGGHVAIPDLPTKIMMNLWIFTGGGFGGPRIGSNQYPFHSEYDWFRFYKWDGDKQYPCQAMDESCLQPDDLYLAGNNPCDGIEQQGTIGKRRPCKAVCTRR